MKGSMEPTWNVDTQSGYAAYAADFQLPILSRYAAHLILSAGDDELALGVGVHGGEQVVGVDCKQRRLAESIA